MSFWLEMLLEGLMRLVLIVLPFAVLWGTCWLGYIFQVYEYPFPWYWMAFFFSHVGAVVGTIIFSACVWNKFD